MVAINYVARRHEMPDVQQKGPQRTKWQAFQKGLKKAGRCLLAVATLGISEGIVRHTLKGRGAKVSSRANHTTSMGMNRYLRSEMNTVLNGSLKPVRFCTREHAEHDLGSLTDISNEVLGSVFKDSVTDFSRAKYVINGHKAETGKNVLEGIIEVCTEKGEIDHGALRALTGLANQSIHATIMAVPSKFFMNQEPPQAFGQNTPSNLTYSIKTVTNSRGEKEFLLETGLDMKTLDSKGNTLSTGSQTAMFRLTRNEDNSWQVNLEDYQVSLQPTEGNSLPNISSKAMGQLFREYISENTGVVGKPQQIRVERNPPPTVPRLGEIFSQTHRLLNDSDEVTSLERGGNTTIFRGNTDTIKTLTEFTKELSVNYVRDTFKTVVDYANTTGQINLRNHEDQEKLHEDQEKLRGLFQLLMGKMIGGSDCEQRNIDAVPKEVCDLCKTIRARLKEAGATDQVAKNGAMSFLFLRTLTPALISSSRDNDPIGNLGGKPEAQSIFTGLSQLLTYSANGTLPKVDGQFGAFRTILGQYAQGMSNFMDGILTRGENVPEN